MPLVGAIIEFPGRRKMTRPGESGIGALGARSRLTSAVEPCGFSVNGQFQAKSYRTLRPGPDRCFSLLARKCVGTKMLVNAAFDAKIIPTELALISTALPIGGSVPVSVFKTRHLPNQVPAESIHGWVPGSPAEADSDKASSSRSLGTDNKAPDKKGS